MNYNEDKDGAISILSYMCPICGQIIVSERIIKYPTCDNSYALQDMKDAVGIHFMLNHNGSYKRTKKRINIVLSKRRIFNKNKSE